MQKRGSVLVFGDFEADVGAGVLRRNGAQVAIQEKVFQLLVALASRPGELVTREELRRILWPAGTHVDFNHNLNNAVAKLRAILSVQGGAGEYIETLGSRGYRFVQPSAERTPASRARDAKRIRLVVLPFSPLNRTKQEAFFTAAITDEIITCLGHLFAERLGVIARTTALRYARTSKTIAQIGKELRVGYVLEGTVYCDKTQTHLTTQLIRVSDQTQIWAARYDCNSGEPFRVQAEIAQQIAQALGLRLLATSKLHAVSTSPGNFAAYVEFLKGRHHQSRRTRADLLKSIAHFERCIELDPSYVLARAGLALTYAILGWGGLGAAPPQKYFLKAKEYAVAALRMDDSLAESHTALGMVKFLFEWDFRSAERLIRQAIALNPSDAMAHQVYGYCLLRKGEPDRALAESLTARDLDPLSVSANLAVGVAHYLSRRYEDALSEISSAVGIDSESGLALMWLGVVLVQMQLFEEGLCALKRAHACDPENMRILAWLAAAYARAGQREEALDLLRDLLGIASRDYVCPLDLALIYAELSDTNQAFAWLHRALDERAPLLLLLLRYDPRLDNLRASPQFSAVSRYLEIEVPLLHVTENAST